MQRSWRATHAAGRVAPALALLVGTLALAPAASRAADSAPLTLEAGPLHFVDLRPDGGKYDRFIRLWKRLPVAVTRWIGPSIVRGIP